MRIGVVVFTSLENFAVITIVPRNEPIACTTVYLAFEQLGAGHYDAVIESPVVSVETTFAYYKPSEDSTKPDIDDHSKAHSFHPACRCGQGAVKINRNENTVQSTSLVVNAFAVQKAAQLCVVAEIVLIRMECEYKEKMKYHQESRHESAESIRNLVRQGEIS